MSKQRLPVTDIAHPVPHRHRVGLLALGFALLGAPLAWNIALLFTLAAVVLVPLCNG